MQHILKDPVMLDTLPLYSLFLYNGELGMKVEINSALGYHNWVCLNSHSKNRVGRLQYLGPSAFVNPVEFIWQPIETTPITITNGDDMFEQQITEVNETGKTIVSGNWKFKKLSRWTAEKNGIKRPSAKWEVIKEGESTTWK